MSKYTTEVRYICESFAYPETYHGEEMHSSGFHSVDDILDKSWDKVFTTKAPIFDEAYRPIICKKILKHYYMREICAETVGLWQLWLNTRLEEVLPYYNQMWESERIKFDPLKNTDYTDKKDGLVHKDTEDTTVQNTQTENTQTTDDTIHDEYQKSGWENKQQGVTTISDNITDHKNITEVREGGQDVSDTNFNTTVNEHLQRDLTEKDTTNYGKTQNDKETIDGEIKNTEWHGFHGDEGEEGNKEDTNWNLFNDTPQGGLNGILGHGDSTSWNNSADAQSMGGSPGVVTGNMQYLTNATQVTDNEHHNDDSNYSGEEEKSNSQTWPGYAKNNNMTQGGTDVTDKALGGTQDTTTTKTGDEITTTDYGKTVDTEDRGRVNEKKNETTTTDYKEQWAEQGTDDITEHKVVHDVGTKDFVGDDVGVADTTEDWTTRVMGKIGTENFSSMLLKFRETFLNIDRKVIGEFNDLFFNLW